jgi:hypothetical protein
MPTPSSAIIQPGLCQCGCGRLTVISPYTCKRDGYVAREPRPFLQGHHIMNPPQMEMAQPFKIDGVYCRLVPLTQGLYAIVDATDYEWLMRWKWFARLRRTGIGYDAMRHSGYKTSKDKTLYMSRVVLGVTSEDLPTVDHENHNTLDNRRKNLRPATYSQQSQNRIRGSNNSTGFKGVSFCSKQGKYQAQIAVSHQRTHLGFRDTPEEAYGLYCEAAKRLHGRFAQLV